MRLAYKNTYIKSYFENYSVCPKTFFSWFILDSLIVKNFHIDFQGLSILVENVKINKYM